MSSSHLKTLFFIEKILLYVSDFGIASFQLVSQIRRHPVQLQDFSFNLEIRIYIKDAIFVIAKE